MSEHDAGPGTTHRKWAACPEYETLRSEIEQPLLVRLLNSINVLMSHFVQKMTKDLTTIIGADSRRATCFQGFDAE